MIQMLIMAEMKTKKGRCSVLHMNKSSAYNSFASVEKKQKLAKNTTEELRN